MRSNSHNLVVLIALLAWQFINLQSVVAGTELFLDDYVVQGMSGLARTMHQPEKYGPVMEPTGSDGQMIQFRSAPMWDPAAQHYKLVYIAYTWDSFSTIGMAMATSADGINWTKPNLGQGISVYGSTANNRITPIPGSKWTDPTSNCMENVVIDPCDPNPNRRFKSFVVAYKFVNGSQVLLRLPFVSPDCLTWTNTGAEIVGHDEANLTFDQGRGQFLAILKTGNQYGRAQNFATSYDFTNWTTPQFMFGADATDQTLAIVNINAKINDDGLAPPAIVDPQTSGVWHADSYNTAVFPYAGVYIGMPSIFHSTGVSGGNTDGFQLIQLMMSRNLTNWTRLGNRQPFIPPGRIGSWSNRTGLVGVYDRIQMFATNPLEMGDELWFYYSGMKFRDSPYGAYPQGWYCPGDSTKTWGEGYDDLCEGHGAVCLAKLRRDGFISLDTGAESGFVLLKPMTLAGTTLYLNLDASAGRARVEVLGENGEAIPGFSYLSCIPVSGDMINAPVQWTGADISQLAGQTVQFKIYLHNAKLYSFTTDFTLYAGSWGSGGTTAIFQDNFDTNTTASTTAWPATGDYDPDHAAVGTWGVSEYTNKDVQVSSYVGGGQPAAHSGSNLLISGYHYEYYNNWAYDGLPCANFAGGDITRATVDFWVWGKEPVVSGNTMAQIVGYQGSNAAGVGAFMIRLNANGAILWHDGGGFVTATATWTADSWNHVVIGIDLTTDIHSLSVNGSTAQQFTGSYGTDTTMGCVRFYGDETCYYDDILVYKTVPGTDLTMIPSPDMVGTVTPSPGTHRYAPDTVVSISATRYVGCPNVDVFDHWVGSNIANPALATTSVTMNTAKTVTAVYSDGRACGDECHSKPIGDLDSNCHVDWKDLGTLASNWLDDTSPQYSSGNLNSDNIINLKDLAMMAANWLECTAPECD